MSIIDEVLELSNIKIVFQPIVSVNRKKVVGLEALCRGQDKLGRQVLSPTFIFKEAKKAGRELELDRLCRSKALESFAGIAGKPEDLMLFLNLETSIIDKGVVGSNHLRQAVDLWAVEPEQVVIEIIETKVKDIKALEKFVATYRAQGFSIALDDIGMGNSNWDRIAILKPDILKICGSLLEDIDKEYYKQQLFSSFTNLAKKIGALVIAEGVETEGQALAAQEFGADLLQGYYFAKPQCITAMADITYEKAVECHAFRAKEHFVDKIRQQNLRITLYNQIMTNFLRQLASKGRILSENNLLQLINTNPMVECLYILDVDGLQVSKTLFNDMTSQSRRSRLFDAAPLGADHSMKEYFFMIKDVGLPKYISNSYISSATGNQCITASAPFAIRGGQSYILCLDIGI